MTFELVETGVDLAVVESLHTLSNRLHPERLRIQLRVDAKDVEDDAGCGAVVASTNNVTVADDEDELSLIVIVESRKRIDRTPQRLLAFGVTRNLTENELVEHFGITLAAELESGQD